MDVAEVRSWVEFIGEVSEINVSAVLGRLDAGEADLAAAISVVAETHTDAWMRFGAIRNFVLITLQGISPRVIPQVQKSRTPLPYAVPSWVVSQFFTAKPIRAQLRVERLVDAINFANTHVEGATFRLFGGHNGGQTSNVYGPIWSSPLFLVGWGARCFGVSEEDLRHVLTAKIQFRVGTQIVAETFGWDLLDESRPVLARVFPGEDVRMEVYFAGRVPNAGLFSIALDGYSYAE